MFRQRVAAKWFTCPIQNGNMTPTQRIRAWTTPTKEHFTQRQQLCLPETGELLAWDPVTQKEAWRAKSPVVETGGVLSTGGNLVFQGRADGMLVAYRATDGKQLWQFDAGTGIMAPPVTYTVNGVQYVTVMAGWGGGAGLFNAPGSGPVKPGYGRILTFAIGGQAKLKVPSFGPQGPPPMPQLTYDSSPELVHRGAQIFNSRCMLCHGLNAVGASLPDLRYSSKEMIESLDQIVA